MNINEFCDLSDFALGEAEKIDEVLDIGPPKKLIKCISNQIVRYTKLYSKPLFKAEKRRIKLWEAIDTMPHGFWWKLLHSKLWKQVKAELESQGMLDKYEKEKKQEPEKQVYYPVIVKESSVPEIYEEDEEQEE